MTAEEKRAEEAKRERAWDPRQRWRAILAAIDFTERNLPPEQRRNRPRWHPGSAETSSMMPRELYTLADLRDARWPAATAREDLPPVRLSVFGDPVAHSLSPGMHNAALAACGIKARYTRLHVRLEELEEALRLLPERDFLGTNLTIPHKTAALGLVDEIDDAARRLGAVNTVRVEPDGRLRGFNTDGPGFVRAVRAEFGAEVRDLRVLVLGAGGGAGRAIATQCALEGCAGLRLSNRTAAKAQALAEELPSLAPGLRDCRAVPWKALPLGEIDLVVNATSLGLKADDAPAVAAEGLRAGLLVFDTVYRRDGQPTPLLAAARAAGARAIGGLPLLLHQGALSFEIWFGRPAPLAEMEAALGKAEG